jgi:hypothetical protein
MTFRMLAVLLLVVVAASSATAAIESNELGIYADPLMGASWMVQEPFVLFDVYVVVFDPRLPDGSPLPAIEAFEFHAEVTSPNLVLLVSTFAPVAHINVADAPNDYIVGVIDPLPVTPGAAVLLMTFSYISLTADPQYFTLSPPTEWASVPGRMSCAWWDPVAHQYRFVPMNPNSGSHDLPTFSINGTVVATENTSWGNLKSLFH